MSDAIARGGNSDFHADAENPPDDLRTRLAMAVRLHLKGTRFATMRDPEPCGLMPYEEQRIAELVADAVIRELGLFQQWLVDGSVSDGEPRAWELPCETRYVTEWKRFDA